MPYCLQSKLADARTFSAVTEGNVTTRKTMIFISNTSALSRWSYQAHTGCYCSRLHCFHLAYFIAKQMMDGGTQPIRSTSKGFTLANDFISLTFNIKSQYPAHLTMLQNKAEARSWLLLWLGCTMWNWGSYMKIRLLRTALPPCIEIYMLAKICFMFLRFWSKTMFVNEFIWKQSMSVSKLYLNLAYGL